jgi:hypothetical protein
MRAAKHLHRTAVRAADSIHLPSRVRARIAADAERCGRSFEGQVIAVLRRHYGEDVDIAPAPSTVVALAQGSLKGLARVDQRQITRRLREEDEE